MYTIIIIAAFSLLLWGLTSFLKARGFSMESKMSPKEQDASSPVKDYLNDSKLTERWQTAKDMRLVTEGKKTVKNGEDRFHLTGDRDERKY